MANPLLVKSGVVALSVGGAGMIGWQITAHLSKEEKTDFYLSKQKRERASSEEDWKKIKTFYSSAEQSELISSIPKENVKEEDIKNWCNQELDKPLKDQTSSNLKLIETWCSKPRTLTEQITFLNRVALNVDVDINSNPHKTVWEGYAENYKTVEDKFKIQKSNNGGTDWVDFTAGEATADIMKAWCKDKKDKQYKHSDDSLFKTYQKWCSK